MPPANVWARADGMSTAERRKLRPAAGGFQIARTETIPGGFPVGFLAAIAG